MTTRPLLLFDFDGVLADSLTFYADTVIRALARVGTPVIRNREEYIALFDGNFYETLIAQGVDLAAFGAAVREINPGFEEGTMAPYPGLAPVLEALHRDRTLAVVSSNGLRTISGMLGRYGLASYFDKILGSDFHFSKTEKIAHAMATYGVPRERTFYIGDTVGDVREAKAAGVVAVAVTWGWHDRERLVAAGPDLIVDTPEGLLSLK